MNFSAMCATTSFDIERLFADSPPRIFTRARSDPASFASFPSTFGLPRLVEFIHLSVFTFRVPDPPRNLSKNSPRSRIALGSTAHV